MEDRELLELAAKAAEIDAEWDDYCKCMWQEHPTESSSCYAWNPLKDDGDALRLKVKAKVPEYRIAHHRALILTFGNETDEMAIERLAITRAAAEVFKEIE